MPDLYRPCPAQGCDHQETVPPDAEPGGQDDPSYNDLWDHVATNHAEGIAKATAAVMAVTQLLDRANPGDTKPGDCPICGPVGPCQCPKTLNDASWEQHEPEEARDKPREDLDEARMWARHGYEIGQRHCGWSDHGVAPAWLTDGWPNSFDSCEHLKQASEYDTALSRVRDALGLDNDPGIDLPGSARDIRRELDQAREAIRSVLHIHRGEGYRGGAICVHCSALDDQGSTDNAPVAYPCDTVRRISDAKAEQQAESGPNPSVIAALRREIDGVIEKGGPR